MSNEQLSFVPDRRSTQSTFYHFSERGLGTSEMRSFSQEETMQFALSRIYRDKFTDISEQFRSVLVGILVNDIPLEHHNLTMLAAAMIIFYYLRGNGTPLNTNPLNYSSPQCETGQCGSTSPIEVLCKQQYVSVLDQSNKVLFDQYYNFIERYIMPDVTGKKPQEIENIRINNKITLVRYITYIQDNIPRI